MKEHNIRLWERCPFAAAENIFFAITAYAIAIENRYLNRVPVFFVTFAGLVSDGSRISTVFY